MVHLIEFLYSISYNFVAFLILNRYLPKTVNWSLMMSLFTVSVIFLSVSYYFQLSSSVIQLPFIIVTIGRSLLHVVHYSWHMLTNCIYTERNLASLLISSYSLSPVLQIYFHFVVFFFPKNHRIIVFFR